MRRRSFFGAVVAGLAGLVGLRPRGVLEQYPNPWHPARFQADFSDAVRKAKRERWGDPTISQEVLEQSRRDRAEWGSPTITPEIEAAQRDWIEIQRLHREWCEKESLR